MSMKFCLSKFDLGIDDIQRGQHTQIPTPNGIALHLFRVHVVVSCFGRATLLCQHPRSLLPDARITLDCWIPYLIYPHREEDDPQFCRACETQNVERHCPYHCSKAVGVILSLFGAISLSCRACFTFPSSSPPLFLLQLGKRPQATAIVGGCALRWELRGIIINHQLQSLNPPRMMSSPILFFCILRERKPVFKYLELFQLALAFSKLSFRSHSSFSRTTAKKSNVRIRNFH